MKIDWIAAIKNIKNKIKEANKEGTVPESFYMKKKDLKLLMKLAKKGNGFDHIADK